MGSGEWLTAGSLPSVRIKLHIVQPVNAAGKGAGNGEGRYVGIFNENDERRNFMDKENATQQALFSEYPDVVNVEQLSVMLGISTKTAYRLLKEEKIKSIHIGRTYRIAKIHILKYLELSE